MEPQLETRSGRLEGLQLQGYQAFKGIPFAKPPVGTLRLLPPQPAEPWPGVREAKAYGSAALQRKVGVAFMDAGVPLDEDCLFLNVYTPSCSGSRPVLVWIHGGGFNLGSGSQAGYEGGQLVTRGDVVLVTINYRLGLLGYLYLGEHGGDAWGASANLGQLDQIAALRWVRDNIAAFGGDPGNVTVFGESAGSAAVAALLAMPEATGLYHRVIGQSGTANAIPDARHGASIAGALLKQLGLGPEASQKLQEVPSAELFRAQNAALAELGNLGQRGRGRGFAPIVDGKTIPVSPLRAVRDGMARGVPIIFGTNRDEDKFGEALAGRRSEDFDAETLLRRVSRLLGRHSERAAGMIEVYRASRAKRGLLSENRDILSAITTDQRQRLPAIRLVEAQRAHASAYNYLFCWEQPVLKAAIHGLEIPFVFGKAGIGRDPMMQTRGAETEQLSRFMLGAWCSFARSGDPALPELAWDPYDSARRATMVYGERSELVDAPFEEERAAWDDMA